MTRRRLIAPLALTAAAGTWYALSPSTPEVEYRFSVSFDCDGDGEFSLRDWHGILSSPPEALGSPLVAWTAIMGKGKQ